MTGRNAPLCTRSSGTNCINLYVCCIFINIIQGQSACYVRTAAEEDKKGRAVYDCKWTVIILIENQ